METRIPKEQKTIIDRLSSIKEQDYYNSANLHIHSTFSDGKVEFSELVSQAQQLGLKHFSICDHNTVLGYKNFDYKNCEELIPAVEFDCMYFGVLIHIIGYGIDPNNIELNKICAQNEKETKFDLVRIFKSRHPKKAIQAIHKAGGIAVLAHPCCLMTPFLDSLVKKLKSYGLDGIEQHYKYSRFRSVMKFHSRKKIEKISSKYSLIRTGGTDEHGSLLHN